MLKIGIIGLGAIAEKAYLPVVSGKNVEIHLCSRNESKLHLMSAKYRLYHLHRDIGSLINAGIHAAFVHTATDSHEPIVAELLSNGIHVYVDKPVTYDYPSTQRLFKMAKQAGRILHVGFNRRYAPAYRQLKSTTNATMIIMQKNRHSQPGDVRTFIFDDFIHVVDTILFLFAKPIDKMIVNGRKNDGLLQHVVLQLCAADGTSALGIMNRDSAIVEERLEVFTPVEKIVVDQLVRTTTFSHASALRQKSNDWESTLNLRGFDQVVDNFLAALGPGSENESDSKQSLLTHEICEQVVERLDKIR